MLVVYEFIEIVFSRGVATKGDPALGQSGGYSKLKRYNYLRNTMYSEFDK